MLLSEDRRTALYLYILLNIRLHSKKSRVSRLQRALVGWSRENVCWLKYSMGDIEDY